MQFSYFIHKNLSNVNENVKWTGGLCLPAGQICARACTTLIVAAKTFSASLVPSSVLCERNTSPDGYIDLQPVFAVVPFHGRREVLDTFVDPVEPTELLVIA